MTLGEQLRQYLDKIGMKQQALGAQFSEEWQRRHDRKEQWSTDTLTSRISECLKDKTSGLRFFFKDRAKAVLLLELLAVPEDEREALLKLGEQALLGSGEPPPRLVVDIDSLLRGARSLRAGFDALWQLVPALREVGPLALVLTAAQHNELPRSFDGLGGLRVETLADGEEPWARVCKLAGEDALVMSGRRFDPISRWLAGALEGSALRVEPAEWLEQFKAQGRLSAPGAVAHDLAALLGDAALPSVRVPDDPREIRRRLLALADEAQAQGKPAARLALARALGGQATSTAQERQEAEQAERARQLEAELSALAQRLGQAPRRASAEELRLTLEQAARRPVEQTVLRVGDRIHVINPAAAPREIVHSLLALHEVPCRTPAIRRLMSIVDHYTQDEVDDDPTLMRAVERLDPSGNDRAELLYARACLLWSKGLVQAQPAPPVAESEWLVGLRSLVQGAPPQARLRVEVGADATASEADQPQVLTRFLTTRTEWEQTRPGWLPARLRDLPAPFGLLLQGVPARGPLLLERTEAPQLVDYQVPKAKSRDGYRDDRPKWDTAYFYGSRRLSAKYYEANISHERYGDDDHRTSDGQGAIKYRGTLFYGFGNGQPSLPPLYTLLPPLLLPTAWKPVREEQTWLDLLECSRALAGEATPEKGAWDRVRQALEKDSIVPLLDVTPKAEDVQVAAGTWARADRELALFWLAMQRALRAPQAVRSPDGTILLSLGAGLLARIYLRRQSAADPGAPTVGCQAALRARVRRKTEKSREDNKPARNWWQLSLVSRRVLTHQATTTGYGDIQARTTLGYALPSRIYLQGHGLRATISFLMSPFFLASGPVHSAVQLAAAGAQALSAQASDDEEAERQAQEDYDD